MLHRVGTRKKQRRAQFLKSRSAPMSAVTTASTYIRTPRRRPLTSLTSLRINGFMCDARKVARWVRLVRVGNAHSPRTSIFDRKLTSLLPLHRWHATCLRTGTRCQMNQYVSMEVCPLNDAMSNKPDAPSANRKQFITRPQDVLQVRHQEARAGVETRSSERSSAPGKSSRSVFATPRFGVISTQSVRSLFALQCGRPQGRRLQPSFE
jgi:hypothetical protein